MTMEVRPLHPGFGAEVIGVDLAGELDTETVAAIEAAWTRQSILLFRDQRMSPAQQVAFTRRLGTLHVMEPLEFNVPGWPEVFVVSNVEENGKPVGLRRAGWGWHSDGEDKAIPNAGSLLHALEVPPEGGDTLFADTYAAFAALPAEIRRAIDGRRACFSRVRLLIAARCGPGNCHSRISQCLFTSLHAACPRVRFPSLVTGRHLFARVRGVSSTTSAVIGRPGRFI